MKEFAPITEIDGRSKLKALPRARPRPTVVTMTAAELAAQDFPPVAFVIPRYVAEGPLTGAADTVLVLSRNPQGTTLYGRGRDIEEIETALAFDRVAGLWSALGNASEVHRSDERTKLLAALNASVAPLGPRDLASVACLKDANVRQLLGKMVAAGEIERTGYGRYRAATAGHTGHTGSHISKD